MAILSFEGFVPQIADDVFIARGAQVIGQVMIGSGASIWYNCVLRGDVESITVGAGTNIQDGTIVHVTTGLHATTIGADCLVGHSAIIHGCTLMDNSFIGLGATVMDGCVIEQDGMLAAGAMLPPGKRIAAGELWAGLPAKPLRLLSEEEVRRNRQAAKNYSQLAKRHKGNVAEIERAGQ